LQPHWPKQPLEPYFLKKLPDPDSLIINGIKMTSILLIFCEVVHQKSELSLTYGTVSVGGC
jgi:hypothetical protein